jgi:putative ABC transport system permease protein
MFGARDLPQGCKVAIVNEQAAAELFDGDPVGRTVQDPTGAHVEIVGVVAVRTKTPSGAVRPTIYYYADQMAPPFGRTGPATLRVPTLPEHANGMIGTQVVTAGYFDAMDMPVAAGRVFSDGAPAACRVGVVNEEAAELYFNGNAVGGAIVDPGGIRTTIVGVVRGTLLRTSQRRDDPVVYFPLAQDFLPRMTLILGTHGGDRKALRASVERSIEAAVGGASPVVVRTLEEQLIRTSLATERILTVLTGSSAGTALLLGLLGLYGAMSDAARQRRREIATRLALGARRWHLTRQLVAEGVRLALAGAVVGTIGSRIVARWLGRTPATDPLTSAWIWLAAPLALLAAVVIASILPVRRALRVDPSLSMREN